MTVVTQIGGGERAEEIRSEPAAEVTLNFHPNKFCHEDRRSMFIWNVSVHLVSTMNAAFKEGCRTNCIFTFTNVLFPADHSTVCSASTCAVPGFASRRAPQVSAVTALCCMCSRPFGGSGRGALSEEGTAKHWNSSGYYAAFIMKRYDIRYMIRYMIWYICDIWNMIWYSMIWCMVLYYIILYYIILYYIILYYISSIWPLLPGRIDQ